MSTVIVKDYPLQISVDTECPHSQTTPLQISVDTECQRLHTSPSSNCPHSQTTPFKYLLTLRYLFTLSVRHCIPLLPIRVSTVSRLLTPCHTAVHTQCYRLHASCSWDCSQSVLQTTPLQMSVHTQCQRLHIPLLPVTAEGNTPLHQVSVTSHCPGYGALLLHGTAIGSLPLLLFWNVFMSWHNLA